MIYLCLFAFVAALFCMELHAVHVSGRSRAIPPLLYVLGATALICVASLRSVGTGDDDYNYLDVYESVPPILDLMDLKLTSLKVDEAGFIFANSLSKSLNLGLNGVFMMMALISLTFIFLAIRNFANRFYLLSVLIFLSHVFLYRETMQVRAAAGYSIVLYAFTLLADGKRWLAFAMVLLAAQFHFTAIVALGLFLVPLRRRFSVRVVVGGLTLTMAASHFLGKSSLIYLFGLFVFLNPEKFESYVLDSAGMVYSLGLLNPTLIKQLGILVLALWVRPYLMYKINEFNSLINIYLVSIFFLIVFKDFAVFGARFASLFSYVEVLFLPSIALAFSVRSRVYVLAVIVSVYFCLFCLNLFVKNIKGEYSTILY